MTPLVKGATDDGAGLRAGAIRIDITPSDLAELNPVGGGSFADVHDPIHLRVLLLANGAVTLALIAVDLIEVGDMVEIRQRIAAELGIPAAHVIITASHDHNAPRLGEVSPGALGHGGNPEQRAYTAMVYERMLEAVGAARRHLRPARLGFGQGAVDININRDVPSGGRYELGLNPDGVSDKTVSVIRVEGFDGTPIAVWFNYAVHSTVTLWTQVLSGDLAGAAERYVEAAVGGIAMFTPGALGDQAPRLSYENATPEQRQDPTFAFEAAEHLASLLGAEVARVAASITDLSCEVRLHAAEKVTPCPVKRGEEVMASMRQDDAAAVELRVSLVRLDDLALVGVNGEAVTAIGRALQQASPLTRTVVVSLVNDRVGYLVDDAAYALDTFEARGCPVQPGHIEPRLTDALQELLAASESHREDQ